MKVAHLTRSFDVGGAGHAIRSLHDAMRKLGHDSRVFFQHGEPTSERETRLFSRRSWSQRVHARLLPSYAVELSADSQQTSAASVFSDRAVQNWDNRQVIASQSDLYCLNWVAQFLDLHRFFSDTKTVPVVWRLTDLNPLTGGCHSTMGCERFRTGCVECPQLSVDRLQKRVGANWERKRLVFDQLDRDKLTLVAQSQWMVDQLDGHPFLGRFARVLIRNGIDSNRFGLSDQTESRMKLGLPGKARLGLIFASRGDRRRATDECWDSIRSDLDDDRQLIVVGSLPMNAQGHRFVHQFDKVKHSELSAVYAASDYLIFPHRQDNCPNTVLESQACGRPVIAFRNSGIEELIEDGLTGCLVKDGDFSAISRVNSSFEPRQFSAETISASVESSLEVAKKYVSVFQQAIERQK